jgi:hypothetical protein
MNYSDLNSGVSPLVSFLRSLAWELPLADAAVEVWRWDQPVATLTWRTPDYVSHNIHVWLPPGESEVVIEANAWYDEDRLEQRTRHWTHSVIDRLPTSELRELGALVRERSQICQLEGSVRRAIVQCTAWTRTELDRHAQISGSIAGGTMAAGRQ